MDDDPFEFPQGILDSYVEYILRPSPIMEALAEEGRARYAALPRRTKIRWRIEDKVTAARIRISKMVYPWSDDY